jgi:superfamily I DNA/RNA helicase
MANLDLTYSPDERTDAFENHATGFLISLAGPGTGKTSSFLKRTQALTSRGVSQDSICYLTFIKEISNAFIEDYIEEFGRESYEANKPRISTLHSFACRLLRNQGFQIGYDGELYFANTADPDSNDATTVLSDLLEFVIGPDCSSVAQLRKHMNCVKRAWRDEVDPLCLPDPIPTILPQAENLFKAFRVVDWDQTITLAHALALYNNFLFGLRT